jgi:hypothetical protein
LAYDGCAPLRKRRAAPFADLVCASVCEVVAALGYSKDAGMRGCRSNPVHQLGRIATHHALRLGIDRHLLDRGDHVVTD